MRPSFSPPPKLFWSYTALAVLFVVVMEATDEGEAAWWGLLISVALLVGLYRGLKLAWWLLLVSDVWTVVAVLAIQAEGLAVDFSVYVLIVILIGQLAALLAIRQLSWASPERRY
jgi:hypothetical protein